MRENYNDYNNNNYNQGNQNMNEENTTRVRRVVVKTSQTPKVTYLLIAINVIVFAIINLVAIKTGRNYSELLSVYGAKENMSILNGEYWRFITPIFLHANITHLLVNCYSLYAVGSIVERMYGYLKFIFIYLVAGFMGSLLSFMFTINPSVGASGAIFGLLGALLYFGIEFPKLFKTYFGRSILMILGLNLAYGIMNSSIDNFGHIGGLIGGFFASGIVKIRNNYKAKVLANRTVFIVLTIVIAAIGLIYGFNFGNNSALAKLDKLYEYDESQNWKEAASIGEEILKLKPTNNGLKIQVLWMTIKAEALTGNYNKAVEYAKTLKDLSPKDGHYMLGIVYYDMGQFQLAKEELQKAKALNAPYSNIDELIMSIEIE